MSLIAWGDRLLASWTQRGRPDTDIYGAFITPEPVSVEVTNFAAESDQTGVLLRWSAAGDGEITGFRVHRAANEDGPYEVVSPLIPADGNAEYSYADAVNVAAASPFFYRLEIIDRSGNSTWVGPIRVEGIEVYRMAWLDVSPNPLRTTAQLRLSLPGPGEVSVQVFDVRGRWVHREVLGRLGPGTATYVWDGRDDAGEISGPGVYFIQADQEGEKITTRIVKIP